MRKAALHTAFGEAKSLQDWAKDPRCHSDSETLAVKVRAGMPLEAAIVFSQKDTQKGYWAFGEVRRLALWLKDPRVTTPASILRRRMESGERFESAITRPPEEPLLKNPFQYGRQGNQREDLQEAMLDLEEMWRVAKLTLFGETKTASEWALKDPRSEVNYMTLMARIRAGWPEDPRIIRRTGVVNLFTHPFIAYTAKGIDLGEFPNLRTAEEAILAISPSGIAYDRVRKTEYAIPRPKKASTNLARAAVPLTGWGETKSSLEWARDPRCLVSITTLTNRLGRKNKRWTPEEAMTTPAEVKFLSERIGLLAKLYTGFGETKTAGEWAKDPRCKVPPTTLNRHLRKGMSVEEALNSGHPLYTAFGETKTMGQWAADPRCKVSPTALASRVSRGQPMEEALKGVSRRASPGS